MKRLFAVACLMLGAVLAALGLHAHQDRAGDVRRAESETLAALGAANPVEARSRLEALDQGLGEHAPAALHHHRIALALAAGERREILARLDAVQGRAEFSGYDAFAAAVIAGRDARTLLPADQDVPGALEARERAGDAARLSLEAARAAVVERAVDWEAARRNAERARRWLMGLEAVAKPEPPPTPEEQPLRPPPAAEDPKEPAPAPEVAAPTRPLSRAEIERMFERVAAKEQEKRKLRERELRLRRREGVKDW